MIDMADLKDGQELVYGKAIQEVAETAERQYEKGYAKYKVHLTTFNGRNAAKDAFEEMVDLAQYVKQLELERDALAYYMFMLLDDENFWRKIPREVLEYCEAIGSVMDGKGEGVKLHARS